MRYFKTKSKTYAIAIQYVTGKSFYKFNLDDDGKVYSFQLENEDFFNFLEKVRQLDNIRFQK